MDKLVLVVVAGVTFLIIIALLFSFLLSDLTFSGQIAVIPIKGEIVSSQGSFSFAMTSTNIAEKIKQADSDPLVSAIFLDIDSSGGSVVATKEVVYAVRKAEKPVVAYIGEIGASGGYYIAAASDLIIADEDSLTGSIGVISMSTNIEGLMEKLGVKVKVMKDGEFKDMGSMFRELTIEEEALLQELISEASEKFKLDILEFREDKLSESEFNEVADGRIFSGRKALEYNLIDFTGSRDFAIDKTAELAGIEGEPVLVDYGVVETDLFTALSQMGYSFGTGFISAIKSSNDEFSLQAK